MKRTVLLVKHLACSTSNRPQNNSLTSSILITQVWKTPNVSKTNRKPDQGENKVQLPDPSFSFGDHFACQEAQRYQTNLFRANLFLWERKMPWNRWSVFIFSSYTRMRSFGHVLKAKIKRKVPTEQRESFRISSCLVTSRNIRCVTWFPVIFRSEVYSGL